MSDTTQQPLSLLEVLEERIAELEGYLDQSRARRAETLAKARIINESLLQACQLALRMSGHDHWDDTMQHGAGCPKCIEQQQIMTQLRSAINDAERAKQGGAK